ncbi:hypothetical protein CPC08DRAFT_738898 [Agrocybe pediades]|nr:hypothetical protein CPC08DRAFT_738898 [Agrocybe pediades]
MCRERIRRDCAFVVEDDDKPGMLGMNVARIQLFFSFEYESTMYPCALVEWFETIGRSKDIITGMWKVCPHTRCHERLREVVHLETLLRGAHLVPDFGREFLPLNFSYTDSLDAFAGYFVNHFADHHMHEIFY